MNNNEMMKINEELKKTISLASCILALGKKSEHPDMNLGYFFDGIELPKIEKGSSITANILLVKIPGYGVNITPPDWLIHMLELCSGNHPGFTQLIYKELLTFINNSRYGGTGIPEKYTITTDDFANCFPYNYPITLDPEIYEKYSKLWDKQKKKERNYLESDNLVDTKEYWMEVMF